MMQRVSIIAPCTIRVDRTAECFQAHMDIDGIEINAGDEVRVLVAPNIVDHGGAMVCYSEVVVTRAGFFARLRERLFGFFDVLELVEVGFAPKERP